MLKKSIRHFFRSIPLLPKTGGLVFGILTWWCFMTHIVSACVILPCLILFFSSYECKVFFLLGIFSFEFSAPSLFLVPEVTTQSMIGEVESVRYPVPGRVIASFITNHGKYECRGKDLPWRNTSHLRAGDHVFLFGTFKKIKLTKNPFTYDSTLFHRGNVGTCKILFASSSQPHERTLIVKIRSWLYAKVSELPFSYDVKGLILGMTIGDTTDLTNAVSTVFKNTGLFHLLVVSGFQLVLIFAILKKISSQILIHTSLSLKAKRVVAHSAAFLVVCFYCELCGDSLATERALVSLGIATLFSLTERRATIFSVTLITFVITLLINPSVLFLPSFHLTFAALFGLCVGKLIKVKAGGGIMPVLTATLSTSVVSYLWFGGGTYLSPVFNLIFSPLFSCFTTLGGLLSLLLSCADGGISLMIVGYGTEMLWKLLKYCSQCELTFSVTGVYMYQGIVAGIFLHGLRGYLIERYIQVLWRKRA